MRVSSRPSFAVTMVVDHCSCTLRGWPKNFFRDWCSHHPTWPPFSFLVSKAQVCRYNNFHTNSRPPKRIPSLWIFFQTKLQSVANEHGPNGSALQESELLGPVNFKFRIKKLFTRLPNDWRRRERDGRSVRVWRPPDLTLLLVGTTPCYQQ